MQMTDQPARKPSVLLRLARQLARQPDSGRSRAGVAASGALQRKQDITAILQRQIGNMAVQRLLAARKGEQDAVSGHAVAAEVEDEIQRARGGGQALDTGARAQMEPALGANLTGVRVHTDGRANQLNQALEARAFTTGQDIFFRQGQYEPGSSTGRELLAHELTHVVQQTGGVQAKLTVGTPDDEYEQEADQVARQVMRQEQEFPGPLPEEDEEGMEHD